LSFLGSLVLGFLLNILVLVHHFLVLVFLSSEVSLSLFDLTDCFLSEGFFIFRTSSFDFFNILKSHSFNGSLLSEEFLLLVLALIRLLKLFVESSPSGGPSESLSLKLSALENDNTSDRNLLFSCSDTRKVFRLLRHI
jgi:hypothetical protein